jgi:hypothetical protein
VVLFETTTVTDEVAVLPAASDALAVSRAHTVGIVCVGLGAVKRRRGICADLDAVA